MRVGEGPQHRLLHKIVGASLFAMPMPDYPPEKRELDLDPPREIDRRASGRGGVHNRARFIVCIFCRCLERTSSRAAEAIQHTPVPSRICCAQTFPAPARSLAGRT